MTDVDRYVRELRSARLQTESEMHHARRMGRPTAHYVASIRRLGELIDAAIEVGRVDEMIDVERDRQEITR